MQLAGGMSRACHRSCRREVGEAGVPREGLKAAATHGVLPVCWTRK